MSLFARLNSPLYSDVFRILDEVSAAANSTFVHGGHGGATSNTRGRAFFSPNFDVHETEHAYVLEGDLPGVGDKKNISIEFTNDNSLHVSGRIDRAVQKVRDEASGQMKIIDAGDEKKRITEAEGTEKEKGKDVVAASRPKYWVSERSVGEFSRRFSFPGQIDVDSVKASLEHGVLKVVVPKMEKQGGRKIEIN